MATVLRLAEQGDLVRIDPGLPPRQQEFRSLYTSPRLVKWLGEILPGLGSTWNIELTPHEQLAALIEVYASGDTLTFDHSFKPLFPREHGVWELKTADLRVFGWFCAKDIFIAHAANLAQIIKDHGLYHGYINEVVSFRSNLDLDEPKFISGSNPNDVVSAFSIP